jgi:hypothetical protein
MKSAVILGRVSTAEKKERRFAIPCQSCGKDLKVVAMVFMYEPYCRRCAFPKVGPPVPTFVDGT